MPFLQPALQEALEQALRESEAPGEVPRVLGQLLTQVLTARQLRELRAQLPEAPEHTRAAERVARARLAAERHKLERLRQLPEVSAAVRFAAQQQLEHASDELRQVEAETAHAGLRMRHQQLELALEVDLVRRHHTLLRLHQTEVQLRAERGEVNVHEVWEVALALAHANAYLAQLDDIEPPPPRQDVAWENTAPERWLPRLARHPKWRAAERAALLAEQAVTLTAGGGAAPQARVTLQRARGELQEVQANLRGWLSARLDALRALRAECEALASRKAAQALKLRHADELSGAEPDLALERLRFEVAQLEAQERAALHRYVESLHELQVLLSA